MGDTITIRDATTEDIGTIKSLAHKIWPPTYGQILSGEQLQYMLDLFYSPAALTNQMQQLGHQFLLITLDEETVGFASFGKSSQPGVFKLHKIYVSTVIQGKGIGRALMDVILDRLHEQEAAALKLNVNRNNKALRFYEKLGFTVVAEENIDIGNGYFMNDYVMEKKL